LVALASSRAIAAPADDPLVIRIGMPAQPGQDGKLETGMPTDNVNGFLEQDFAGTPTKIEWKLVTGAGPGINEAFAGGAVDFAYYGDFPSIIGRAGGLKTRLVVAGERGKNSYLVVPPDSTALSIKDLVGKRVAINKGRPWELALAHLLSSSGLKETDIQLFNLAPADGNAALADRRIDALYTTDGNSLSEKGLGKIIWSTRKEPLDWKYTAEIFVADDFATRYPAATEKVVKAYVQSAYYASLPEHRAEMLHARVTAGDPEPTVEAEYEGIALKDVAVPLLDPFLYAHYQQAIAYAEETKLIRKSFPVEGWFDPQFVTAALKELNLTDYWASSDPHGNPLPRKSASN
jgi:sulfonate transport system substrate-binding protein